MLSFGVSQKEKMFFVEHLSLMLKGGVSLSEALEILKNEARSRVFKKALADILQRVQEGKKLSKSLGLHPKIFSGFFQSLIKVGEESGTLTENLKQAARQMRKDFLLKERVKRAMTYPIILIVLSLIIVFGVSFYILPKLGEYFESLNIGLPLFTRILVGFSYFIKENWPFVIAGFLFFILIFKILLKIRIYRLYFHNFLLSFPIVGRLLRNLYLARFSRSFYTLLKSGVSILENLELCIEMLGNEVYKKNLTLVKSRIAEGEKINQAFKRFPKSFPPVFSGLVLAGEKSGALEESFLSLAQFFEKETDSTLKALPNLIEPVLLILIGLFVLFLGLSIIIPIYQFIGQLGIR